MRLFVAAELSQPVRQAAAAAMEALQDRLRGDVDARWVATSNLHLTVRFIGFVADEHVPAVLAALEPPFAAAPFDVVFGGLGRFPPRGPARVLWIGLGRGLAGLTELHEECNRRLSPLGYPPEDTPFSAHLTLARVRNARGAAGRRIDDALSRVDVPPFAQRVDHLTLVESRLSPKGAVYHPRLDLPLRS